MILKDKIYKFKVSYIDCNVDINENGHKVKTIYSDSDDVYSLEGIPKTAFLIVCQVLNLSEKLYWRSHGSGYMVGDIATIEEAKEELEILRKLDVPERLREDKNEAIFSLSEFCEGERPKKVYINRNIDYQHAIWGRLDTRLDSLPAMPNISPKQIQNGKIYPIEEILKREEKNKEKYDDRAYIGLE